MIPHEYDIPVPPTAADLILEIFYLLNPKLPRDIARPVYRVLEAIAFQVEVIAESKPDEATVKYVLALLDTQEPSATVESARKWLKSSYFLG